jgi:Protein of unknown function (DUF1559)
MSASNIPPDDAPFRFTLRGGMLAVAAAALVFGVLAATARRVNLNNRQLELRNSLKQIGLALSNFEGAHKSLPSAVRKDASGNEISSWRFAIAPYLESFGRHFDLKAPWNSPVNSQLAGLKYSVYCWNDAVPAPHTSVFAVAGSSAAFDPIHAVALEDMPPNLVLLIEVMNSGTHWMQPGDYDVTTLLSHTGRIGDHLHSLLPDRLHVLFADGEVWALSPDAPMTALHPFLTIAGAETHDRNQLLTPYRVK